LLVGFLDLNVSVTWPELNPNSSRLVDWVFET